MKRDPSPIPLITAWHEPGRDTDDRSLTSRSTAARPALPRRRVRHDERRGLSQRPSAPVRRQALGRSLGVALAASDSFRSANHNPSRRGFRPITPASTPEKPPSNLLVRLRNHPAPIRARSSRNRSVRACDSRSRAAGSDPWRSAGLRPRSARDALVAPRASRSEPGRATHVRRSLGWERSYAWRLVLPTTTVVAPSGRADFDRLATGRGARSPA